MYALPPEKLGAVASLLFKSLEEKHLLVFWNEREFQNALAYWGYDAAVKKTESDYLMVVHTNIAGGKSDREVKDRVTLMATLREDGTVVNELSITRTHHGRDGVGFGGVRNVDYVRVYVPEGSTLISATGARRPDEALFEQPPADFSVDEELAEKEVLLSVHEPNKTAVLRSFGKTVFANWIMVDPGESSTMTFVYMLPFTLTENRYTLALQKQPGVPGLNFTYAVSAPRGTRGAIAKEDGSTKTPFTDIVTKDTEYTVTFGTKESVSLRQSTNR
jgi:hypothetical protein